MNRSDAIKEALANYTDDDIVIDDLPVVEETEGGFWVQAWVHVCKPYPEDEEPEA